MSKLTIFYHSENASDASRIIGDLNQYDLDVFSLTELDFKYNFLSIVESVKTPVLILLSQNWLKTGATLYHSLPVLEDLKKEHRLFVVCVDGVEFENGAPVKQETKIETVVDAMPYLKYWQETYLRVRGNRQQLDNAINQEQELVAKVISGEIGNIINFYRDLNPTKFESLIGSNYQPFFDHFGFAAKKVEKTVTQMEDVEGHGVAGEEAPTQEVPQEDVVVQEEPSSDYDETGLGVLVDDIEAEASFYTQVEANTKIEEVTVEKANVADESFVESVIVSMVESVITPLVKPATVPDPEWFESEENPSISEPSLEELAEIPSLSVDNVLEKAAQYFDENKDDLGFNLFENAIESTHSNNTTLRYYYAYYLAQRKSAFEEAIHQLDTILLYDSKNDNAYFLLAELAEIKGNFALAKNYYLETLKLNSAYPHINYRIGVILQEHFKGAADEAANYFRAEIAKDENNIDAQYRLGIYCNESLEDSNEAEKYFLKVLNEDPAHGFANYDLALIYHKKGDPLKAAFYYEEGCKNNPELKTEQNDIAFLAYRTEQKEESITESQPKFSVENFGPIKTILITGATSGIGLATAEQFAKAGNCRLILAGRRVKRLAQITEAIKDNYDIPTTYLQFDIQDVAAVKEAVASLEAPFETVDVLINNAGLALGLSDIVNGDLSDWETMIDTNVKGLLYATKEVAPLMIAQNSGHIINIGSIAGREAYPNGNVYNATKAAVDILTKAMRLDLHKYNIRVGQVAPGHVETEFAINRFHGDEQKADIYKDFTPLSPVDIANIIFFMVTQPPHVNIQDVLVFPTQQASATVINRSGRLKGQ